MEPLISLHTNLKTGPEHYVVKSFAGTLEKATQAHRRQEENMTTCCSKQQEALQTAK